MFAVLGEIEFDLLKGFDSLSVSQKTDYAEHKVITGKPKLQLTGDALDEIDIRLRFHCGFCDPTAEKKKLDDVRLKHEALPFVLGNGTYKGNYVITDISQVVEKTFGDGTIMAIELDIKLKEWVKDIIITGKRKKGAKASGMKKKTSTAGPVASTNKDGYSYTKIVRQP